VAATKSAQNPPPFFLNKKCDGGREKRIKDDDLWLCVELGGEKLAAHSKKSQFPKKCKILSELNPTKHSEQKYFILQKKKLA
jgi:hypothetical protein